MNDDTTKPGLPTVEQVLAHAARYPVRHPVSDLVEDAGMWLLTPIRGLLRLVLLRADDQGRVTIRDGDRVWDPLSFVKDARSLTPRDQQGNPLPLIEELAQSRKVLKHFGKELAKRNEDTDRRVEALYRCMAAAGGTYKDWPEEVVSTVTARIRRLGEELELLRCGNQSYRNRLRLWMKIAVRRQEERDAALARVRELEALRCVCDEESGKHEDTCPVMIHEALVGATEYANEIERERDAAIARAEAAERERDDALTLAKKALDWQNLADYQMLGDPGTPAGQALRAAKGVIDDAVLLSRQPPTTLDEAIDACAAAPEHDELDTVGKRHTLTEEGDCVGWCEACRENRASGRNPDGTVPEHDGRTCGMCKRGRGWDATGRGYCIGMGKVRADGRILPRRALHGDQAPPDDCPGFEPLEEEK
jgi:hypothetical protein